MRFVGSSWEKTDGTEDVPSRSERLSDCLAQKQSGEEDPWMDQFCGVGQGSGLVQRESGPSHLYGLVLPGHQSPVQPSRPRANLFGTGLDEPTLRAFGELTGLAQSPFVEQNSRSPKVKITALFLRNSQAASKEGSRVEEKEGEIKDILADVLRYMEIFIEQSPSPLFSVFGRLFRPKGFS